MGTIPNGTRRTINKFKSSLEAKQVFVNTTNQIFCIKKVNAQFFKNYVWESYGRNFRGGSYGQHLPVVHCFCEAAEYHKIDLENLLTRGYM